MVGFYDVCEVVYVEVGIECLDVFVFWFFCYVEGWEFVNFVIIDWIGVVWLVFYEVFGSYCFIVLFIGVFKDIGLEVFSWIEVVFVDYVD